MPRLSYANTRQADMRYALGMEIPDEFFYLDTGTKKYVFLDHREIGSFEEKNKKPDLEGILSVPLFVEAKKFDVPTSIENKLAFHIIKTYGLENQTIEVPIYFPLDMADFLRSQRIVLAPTTTFFPERAVKTEDEVEIIRTNIQKTVSSFERIEKILRASTIQGDDIIYAGERLTSEYLKLECDRVLLEQGMFNEMNIIISSGLHGAMPHHLGSGEIHAHQAIVCDIFPRNRENGYYADMTRTYVKGKPSEELRKMYDAVLEAQEEAFGNIRAGAAAKEVCLAASDVFIKNGFHVGDVGFVHGLGHGLGMDVHELPYVNSSSEYVLKTGNVITVEPGLYYPDRGGVRIEDVVVVREDGCENLTNYPKVFQID